MRGSKIEVVLKGHENKTTEGQTGNETPGVLRIIVNPKKEPLGIRAITNVYPDPMRKEPVCTIAMQFGGNAIMFVE